MPLAGQGESGHERPMSLTSAAQHHRRANTTPDRHTHRGTPDRQHLQRGVTPPARGTPERHHARGTPDRVKGTPDRARGTPDRHQLTQSVRVGTPDRAAAVAGSQRHQNVSKASSRRQRRHSLNEALLAKRRAEVLRERRVLIVMTGLCCVASTIWLVALSTDYWIMVDAVRPYRSHRISDQEGDNSTDVSSSVNSTTRYVNHEVKQLNSHLGIWRACIVQHDPSDDGCSFHNLDHEDREFVSSPSVAHVIIDYRRTVMALAGLSLLCHLMAVSFSFYTFRNPRYTFKRLAGSIHLMTAATILVLIEVVSNGAAFARSHLTHSLFPPGSESYHGFSYYLAWLVFAQYAAAGLAFLVFSRKRKNLNITDEDGRPLSDDQPRFMGRN